MQDSSASVSPLETMMTEKVGVLPRRGARGRDPRFSTPPLTRRTCRCPRRTGSARMGEAERESRDTLMAGEAESGAARVPVLLRLAAGLRWTGTRRRGPETQSPRPVGGRAPIAKSLWDNAHCAGGERRCCEASTGGVRLADTRGLHRWPAAVALRHSGSRTANRTSQTAKPGDTGRAGGLKLASRHVRRVCRLLRGARSQYRDARYGAM